MEQSEPEVLKRERSVLRRILDLVSQRAQVEAEVHQARTSGDQTADTEFAKARQALADKLERLNREAVAEDEKQRRVVVTAAIDGEKSAKDHFAAGSRKITTLFDAARNRQRRIRSRQG